MTREEAKELLPIIKAYSEGKTIEYRCKGFGSEEWKEVKEIPGLSFNSYEYRIKPKPKYRPFKDAEECWNEMLKHQPFGWVKEKCGIYTNVIIVNPDEASVTTGISDFYSFGDMLKDYTFTDGTPFGIKEE